MIKQLKSVFRPAINEYKYKKMMQQQDNLFECIKNENFQPIDNICPKKINSVGFVLPRMVPGGGGCTSILRIATYLEEKECKVFYTTYIKTKSEKEFIKTANDNLAGYKGTYLDIEEFEKKSFDVVVATNWPSAYRVKKMQGYKMYFVQDYEPYFHEHGDMYYLAENTYKLGFHMVSLGQWNAQQIHNECKIANVDCIDFPYNRDEYVFKERNYMEYRMKNEIRLAVYCKQNSKRLPLLTQMLLLQLKELFATKNHVELKIYIFGFPKECKLVVGENLGLLNKSELLELYQKCDFGMVSSVTNISLVPYEMLATGLPLIEFESGTFASFFPEGSAILTDFNCDKLYQELMECIKKPEIITERMSKALEYMNGLDWQKTCHQFWDILQNVCLKDNEE